MALELEGRGRGAVQDLTRQTILKALAQQTENAFARQVGEGHSDKGHLIRPDWGIADVHGAVGLVTQCGLLLLARFLAPDQTPEEPDSERLLERGHWAADAMLRAQHPSGLIDLRDCNYDSSPDAGFAVQPLCALLELGLPYKSQDTGFGALLEKAEIFVCRAVMGMLTGGFHTPNHRWVMASAMAMAGSLFPDLPVGSVIAAYLAETIDVDAEGMFIERSAGVYDAICDRSLLLLAEHWDCPEAIRAANANLEMNRFMFHADASVETGLSRRQDYGTRSVPISLVAPYLLSHCLEPNPAFVGATTALWQALLPAQQDTTWLTYLLFKYGERTLEVLPLPESYARFFPENGLWRVRRGQLSAPSFVEECACWHFAMGRRNSVA